MLLIRINKCLKHILERIKALKKRLLPNFIRHSTKDYQQIRIPISKGYNCINIVDSISNNHNDLN
jgi:hypothetical protein